MDRLEVDKILLERKQAREDGDWEKSDVLRTLLANHGTRVIDTDRGQDVEAGTEYEFRILQERITDVKSRAREVSSELIELKELVETQKYIIHDFIKEKYRTDYLTKDWIGTCQRYKELLKERGKN